MNRSEFLEIITCNLLKVQGKSQVQGASHVLGLLLIGSKLLLMVIEVQHLPILLGIVRVN